MAAEDCSKVALEAGLKKVKVYMKRSRNGRESAIRSIHNSGVEVTEIIDVTPMPHKRMSSLLPKKEYNLNYHR